jgi:aldehyde dehydrogenase (NAD+)
VGAIVPWNYPVEVPMTKIAAALAAGKTVVLKPAPDTPLNAARLGRTVVEHVDLPPGVFNVVPSSDNLVSEALVTDPRVDAISFTGSTATGRRIMPAGAPTLMRLFPELGGKSAMIMLDDADLDEVVAAAGLWHAGQGNVRKRIEGGARLLTGGHAPSSMPTGFFVEPTLFADVSPDSVIAHEEIFGPVLCVIPYEGEDEAVKIANNSVYGLSGTVLSASTDRALSVARRIRTGTISVNNGTYFRRDMPFGGYKASGIGRQTGPKGFGSLLATKAIGVGVR